MNKYLKCLSPVVLSLFLCGLFAGPGWAKEGDITAKVEMPDWVNTQSLFEIRATFFKENASDQKMPLMGDNAISIELPEGFVITQEVKTDSNDKGLRVYKVIAPKQEGEYRIYFHVANQNLQSSEYEYKINIIAQESRYVQAAIMFGVVILALVALKGVLDSFTIK
jgi:hypothetical protein